MTESAGERVAGVDVALKGQKEGRQMRVTKSTLFGAYQASVKDLE